jgi:hypothetical protein
MMPSKRTSTQRKDRTARTRACGPIVSVDKPVLESPEIGTPRGGICLSADVLQSATPGEKEALAQQSSTASPKDAAFNSLRETVTDNPDAASFKTGVAIAAWPLTVGRDVRTITGKLLKKSRRVLVQDIAEDVRGTLTRDDNYSATPDGLEKAKGWTDLVNFFCEAGTILAAFANRFVRKEDRALLIQNELDSCRREILHNNTASIASHMEVVLSARWGIGAEITRKILEHKLDDALDRTMLQVSLELAPSRYDKWEQRDGLPAGNRADEEQVRLGGAAAQYDEEVRTMARGPRAGEQTLRKRLPELHIWQAIDESVSLPQETRQAFFATLRSHKQNERFRFIGDVLGIPGTTLYDYYKEYRKQNGLQKKRSPNRPSVTRPHS